VIRAYSTGDRALDVLTATQDFSEFAQCRRLRDANAVVSVLKQMRSVSHDDLDDAKSVPGPPQERLVPGWIRWVIADSLRWSGHGAQSLLGGPATVSRYVPKARSRRP
jgi:hypothetical protein